ncbi:hypothetical protein AZA_73075 [Nitrospirillum viridazoti Y2]|nr:hypothetical protein AZA_73075 [Nitrospirillum amazonense Y2]
MHQVDDGGARRRTGRQHRPHLTDIRAGPAEIGVEEDHGGEPLGAADGTRPIMTGGGAQRKGPPGFPDGPTTFPLPVGSA